MNNLKYWVWFARIERLDSKRKIKLLEMYNNDIKKIWNLKKEELEKIDGLKDKVINDMLDIRYRNNLDNIINIMNKQNIKLINYNDKEYPSNLKQIYDMPISLFVKGNTKILNSFSLAIIGCRECTNYGKTIANAIGKSLAKYNIVTVSGLAKGIDSISQKATVDNKGKTIAVIGSGIDNIYPKENVYLAEKIVEEGGAIVSEYVVGAKPEKIHFPARNRIISGLSSGVIVIEAKNRSGTIITVDFALEQGKTVFAVPGNITSNNSEGTNNLIKQGAKCVTCMNDILEEYYSSIVN